MTHATIKEQLAEAQRLMQESADNQRHAELEEALAAHAVTLAKLETLTATK
jgi:hypothetical protein